jgi:serine/threonine protein kinase
MAASSHVSSSHSSSFDEPATGGLPRSFPNLELIHGSISVRQPPRLIADKAIRLPNTTKKGLSKSVPSELKLTPSQFKDSCDYLSKNLFPARSFYKSSKTDGVPVSFLCHRRRSRSTVYLSPTSLFKTSQGHIKLATSLKGKTVALKLIPRMYFRDDEKKIYKLLSKQSGAKKLFIIGPCFEYEKISAKTQMVISKIALVLSYKSEGTLVDFINHYFDNEQPVPEMLSRSVCKQMAEAVAYLHRHGIVHLDIKLENYLMETIKGETKVFLADFGHATFIGRHTSTSFGSHGYRDPILFRKPVYQITIASPAQDIWALGMTMSVVQNSATFQHWTKSLQGDEHYLADMREDSFEYYKAEYLPGAHEPGNLNGVISQCLQLEPDKRITAAQAGELITNLPTPV